MDLVQNLFVGLLFYSKIRIPAPVSSSKFLFPISETKPQWYPQLISYAFDCAFITFCICELVDFHVFTGFWVVAAVWLWSILYSLAIPEAFLLKWTGSLEALWAQQWYSFLNLCFVFIFYIYNPDAEKFLPVCYLIWLNDSSFLSELAHFSQRDIISASYLTPYLTAFDTSREAAWSQIPGMLLIQTAQDEEDERVWTARTPENWRFLHLVLVRRLRCDAKYFFRLISLFLGDWQILKPCYFLSRTSKRYVQITTKRQINYWAKADYSFTLEKGIVVLEKENKKVIVSIPFHWSLENVKNVKNVKNEIPDESNLLLPYRQRDYRTKLQLLACTATY